MHAGSAVVYHAYLCEDIHWVQGESASLCSCVCRTRDRLESCWLWNVFLRLSPRPWPAVPLRTMLQKHARAWRGEKKAWRTLESSCAAVDCMRNAGPFMRRNLGSKLRPVLTNESSSQQDESSIFLNDVTSVCCRQSVVLVYVHAPCNKR